MSALLDIMSLTTNAIKFVGMAFYFYWLAMMAIIEMVTDVLHFVLYRLTINVQEETQAILQSASTSRIP